MKNGTILLVLALAASSILNNAFAKGSGGGSHYSGGSHTSSYSSSGSHSSNYHGRSYSTGSTAHGYYSSGSHHDATDSKAAVGAERDSHGRIKRSEEAKEEFMKQSGYTHGRLGYVVDHIIPLKRGGADSPSNMQWQTIEEAKQKDKWE
jgi:hypothetical protein